MASRIVIGVDGGGSHTEAVALDESGAVIGRGEAGASNPRVVDFKIGAACVGYAGRLAMDDAGIPLERVADAMVCCVSGVGRSDDRKAMRKALKQHNVSPRVVVTHDAEAVLAAGGVFGAGVTVIAGTGSFVWGRDDDGNEARAEGWGSLLGDSSGGFGIGLEALRAVCRAHDGVAPETSLTDVALEHYKINDPTRLVSVLAKKSIPRKKIADFASCVFEHAEAMDSVAVEIIEAAIASLAKSTAAVVAKLTATTQGALPVVCCGGIARGSELFRDRFETALRAARVKGIIDFPDASPALGAARLALHEIGVDAQTSPLSSDNTVDVEMGDDAALGVFEECRALATEQRNLASADIDAADVIDILRVMNGEDHVVAPAVEKVLPAIAEAVERIVAAIKSGGRLFYIGAGTSGRLGVLDASEIPPTFGAPPDLVQGLIAGGYATLLRSREGAEDHEEWAARDLEARRFSAKDALVGLAASRRTPYVLGGMRYAKQLGATTALVTCSPPDATMDEVDILIAPVVGPEVVMGSTRLKSATAQKMVLNMLTTATMIRLGKVYENMMVDLQLSCGKLSQRARRTVMLAAGVDYEKASAFLIEASGSVKQAIVMAKANCSSSDAIAALGVARGHVREALRSLGV